MRSRLSKAILGAGLAVCLQAPLSALAQVCDADAAMANLDFVVEDMHGNDVALSDYKGQVILLDFWATWCAPCRVQIPNFVELVDEYGPEGFVLFGLSVDDPVSALIPYAEELQINYPVLVGADRDDIKNAYGPPVGYPTAFIIDREGRICTSHAGFAEKEVFEAEIVELL